MLYHCAVNEREEPEDQAGDVTLTALDAIGLQPAAAVAASAVECLFCKRANERFFN